MHNERRFRLRGGPSPFARSALERFPWDCGIPQMSPPEAAILHVRNGVFRTPVEEVRICLDEPDGNRVAAVLVASVTSYDPLELDRHHVSGEGSLRDTSRFSA